MSINPDYIVMFGAFVSFLGIASYFKDTIQGKTKPNRVTWFIWAVAPLIATVASISDGVRWEVLPVFMAGFGPLLIFLASFANKKAYWKLARLDYVCGLFSVLALILWGITREPAVAVLFTILSDLFAGIPTIVKIWKYPETENVAPFTTGLFASLTSFTAIRVWNFTSYAFPAYLAMIALIEIGAYYRKRILQIFRGM